MSKTSVRNLIVTLIIFTTVVGLVVITFFNLFKNANTLEGQIAVVAAQNQQEETMIRLQKIAQSSEAERKKLASYFLFRESDTITFLSEIENNLAPNLGIALETNDLKQMTADGTDWIEATFVASGSRKELQNFIDTLESVPFASRVVQVDLSGNSNNDWKANIIIQVQLLSYD